MSDEVDRRAFLRAMSGVGVAVGAAAASRTALAAPGPLETSGAGAVTAAVTGNSGFNVQKSFLALGGQGGWVKSVEGGHATGEVVTEPVVNGIAPKHLGTVRFEDVSVAGGLGMPSTFFQWIVNTLVFSTDPQQISQSGMFVDVDYRNRPVSVLQFNNALITDIAFPAFDAASDDPGLITVGFTPEQTQEFRFGNLTGVELPPLPASLGVKQKKWLPSNFRLSIDGLEGISTRVSRVEPLTIRQILVELDPKFPTKTPSHLEIPNLVVTLRERDAQPFYDWYELSVIRGDGPEKNGTLTALAADLKTTLFTLTFNNLGIFRLTPVQSNGGARRIKAEMYCEQILFNSPASDVPA